MGFFIAVRLLRKAKLIKRQQSGNSKKREVLRKLQNSNVDELGETCDCHVIWPSLVWTVRAVQDDSLTLGCYLIAVSAGLFSALGFSKSSKGSGCRRPIGPADG